MNNSEKRLFLISELINEEKRFGNIKIPNDKEEQRQLLRALMNVRLAKPISDRFIEIQNEYLKEELNEKHITDIDSLKEINKGIYLWQGDITALKCGAIVNAANSGMTGCYVPNHKCIDNCIHTYAGVQLRLECSEIMKNQGYAEPTGKAKITKAYNLPCKYIIHTVGPIVENKVTERDCELLAECYNSCMRLAENSGIESIAFCCISTGEFHFPNDKAAEIAVNSVKEFLNNSKILKRVIFNVFKDIDREIYKGLLKAD